MRGNPVDASSRRTWEPMALSRIGTFGDVLKGITGPMNETGGTMKA
jgi:hypothetical protein